MAWLPTPHASPQKVATWILSFHRHLFQILFGEFSGPAINKMNVMTQIINILFITAALIEHLLKITVMYLFKLEIQCFLLTLNLFF